MKLLALSLSTLLLLACEILAADATFTKSHLTHCVPYYHILSEVKHVTLDTVHRCCWRCYNLGEACPRFHFNDSTHVCELSVVKGASSVRRRTQLFTQHESHTHTVGHTIASPSRLLSLPFIP